MERDLNPSILFVTLKRKTDMVEVLKFHLTPVSLSQTHIDGWMQKTTRISLLKELETRVISGDISNIDTLVTDGTFLLGLLKERPGTFALLAMPILEKVYGVSNADRIYLIFDKTTFPY